MIIKKTILTASLLLGTVGLLAQASATASGGDALGSGGTVSYTVGQTSYKSNIGTNGRITEGIQQPYNILLETALEDTKTINLSAIVFPNPTVDILTIQAENTSTLNLKTMGYQLYNIQCKLLQSENLTGKTTDINMNSYQSGTYLIKIISEDQIIKTFKVIKN